MGLKDLKLPETKIEIPGGGSLAVRGLSLSDIIVLVQSYEPAMRELYEKFSKQEAGAELDWAVLGREAMSAAPSLAATVIALGAGEPDAVDVALTLPAPVQIECLEAIGVHTIETSGGLKKVVETVIRVANATTNAVTSLQKA
jgi:hypothetical protein